MKKLWLILGMLLTGCGVTPIKTVPTVVFWQVKRYHHDHVEFTVNHLWLDGEWWTEPVARQPNGKEIHVGDVLVCWVSHKPIDPDELSFKGDERDAE